MPFNFTTAEYAARLTRTRAAMQTRGIEVLLIADPSNIAWLTGYDAWSFYVPQCALIPQNDAPFWWGRGIDVACAKLTIDDAVMPRAHILGYDDALVQNPPHHPMTDLAAQLQSRGFATAAIGVEMDNYYYSAAAHQTLTAKLPNADWHDATGLVNWQRAIKSKAEIDCMRLAARIVEKMHARALEVSEPGLPKNRLVAEVYRVGIAGVDDVDVDSVDTVDGGDDNVGGDGDSVSKSNSDRDRKSNRINKIIGGDYPAIAPIAPSGADAGAPHLTWDDRPMQNNCATFLEIAGVYRRYHCPLSRTLYLGNPPSELLRAADAIQQGIEACITAATPGNQCADVANALTSVLRRHQLTKPGRCGYSIGLSYPPDWGERTMSFRADDRTRLQPGMTFHLMPGLWFDGWGVEITESLLITETGCETLADYPRAVGVKG